MQPDLPGLDRGLDLERELLGFPRLVGIEHGRHGCDDRTALVSLMLVRSRKNSEYGAGARTFCITPNDTRPVAQTYGRTIPRLPLPG